jgi:threonylcarbamoyladenosine tRNA methylthiotransferase MtaB
MTSVLLHNFGCRVNQAEAFAWAEEFQSRGLRLERDLARSDLIVVNTCALTCRAEGDIHRFLRRITRVNPAARLVLTGCSVTLDPARYRTWPQVRLVVPNADKETLADRVSDLAGAGPAGPAAPYRSRALVKIQDGCDFRCAFCVIPSLRGAGRSLPAAEVASRVRRFADQGFAEVVLAGVNLASYGTDLTPRTSLFDLLRRLDGEAGGLRLRLSSLDPRFLTDELADFLAAGRSLCRHFHLSVQSGSDAVLARMGRRISADRCAALLARLAESAPGAALGADILVGFPGETEEEFERTRRFVEASPLTYIHVFPFSPRAGTPAAGLPQLEPAVKTRRSSVLRTLGRDKNLAFRRTFVGREADGVVVKRGGGRGEVLTRNYIKVQVTGPLPDAKSRVRVRITGATPAGTEGCVCAP